VKAEDIVKQIQVRLPRVTDLFSDTISITSLTFSGGVVTAITSAPHGLSVNNVVTITGAKTPVNITSLTFLDGVATAITATNHDLTEGFQDGIGTDNPLVEIDGATEAEYNGSNPLLSVPSRTKFTYSVTGTPASPATGTPKLLETFSTGYNGSQVVSTTPDATTFTYNITETPEGPASGTIVLHKSIRASMAVNYDRAVQCYTKQTPGDLWLFVVLGDATASKDRSVENDSTAHYGKGTERLNTLLASFSIFVFSPSSSEIAGAAARDLMEDIRPLMFKSVLGLKAPTGLSSETIYGITYQADAFIDYTGAYYSHQFLFATEADIVYEDTVDPDFNVAFRDIDLNFLDELGTVELTASINLDDE
jgi:hypothetical protein